MMALPQTKQEATEALLATLPVPAGQGWGALARKDALSRLRGMGLPARRDEYWKYTDPTTLIQPAPVPAALPAAADDPFAGIEALRIVFTDGAFNAAASDDLAAEGLEIESLSAVLSRDIHWAREVFGVLETAGQNPVVRPLATLNTAIAAEGLVIRVAAGATPKPVLVSYERTAPAGEAMIHHVIRVDQGAEFTFLEAGTAAARLNAVAEVDVTDGATFHHIRVQGPDAERRVASHVFARVGEESRFKTFTATLDGVLTRNDVVVEILGNGAVAHVAGAAVGDGRDFHHDDTVFITHGAQGCESRQVFKKVLKNGATGVFQGKILVRQIAQQTDGYQISQSLLLDGDSQFLCKPELEIYADDVKCSHGSTSGAIDDEALFYLRSRGVPEKVAQTLLVLSFLADAIAEIEEEAVAAAVLARLEGWLARHQG